MIRVVLVVVLSLTFCACQSNQPEDLPTPPAPVAMPIPSVPAWTETKESEAVDVLVVSKPEAAVVFLDGSLVGKTPLPVKVSTPMKLELKLEGYESKEINLDTSTGPNTIVELVPVQPGLDETETSEAGEVPVQTAASSPDPRPRISSVREAKAAYNKGNITRTQYNRHIQRLKSKLRKQLARHKTAYNKGNITRDEYNRRVRKSRLSYEG